MLRVKIADNAYTQQQGLMFVDDLPEDEGMLFVFRKASKLSFWGMNTYIPLDIAFIDEKFKIQKIGQIQVESLKAITSDSPCPYAIEVNAGWFADHDIAVGDTIKVLDDDSEIIAGVNLSDPDYAIVQFNKGVRKDFEKDLSKHSSNIKQSQAMPTDKVDKPDQEVQGNPVTQDVNNVQLPVLDVSNLGKILEDDLDDQQQPQDQQQPTIDENGMPVEQPPAETPPEPETPAEPEKEYPVFSSSYQATEWAEQNNEVLRINYTTKHGRALIRDVEPHGTFHSKSTSKEILVTFDETINDIRAFIIGNISKWAFVGKKFDKKFVVKA